MIQLEKQAGINKEYWEIEIPERWAATVQGTRTWTLSIHHEEPKFYDGTEEVIIHTNSTIDGVFDANASNV
jgi:hypothetical protein